MKNKRKYIIILIISILLVASLSIWGSFAFFSVSEDIKNVLTVNVTVESTGEDAIFTSTKNTEASIAVSSNSMLYGNAGTVAATATSKMNVSLKSKQTIYCTYDIYFKWLDEGDHYEISQNANNEFTVSGSDSTNNFEEIQLNNYGQDTLVKKGAIITASNGTTTTSTWTFTSKFYNLNVNQDYHAGHTYKGYFTTDNVECDQNNLIYW